MPLDRTAAERLVRAGDVPVAVVIPAGLGDAFSTNGFAGGGPSIQLLSDVSDRIAPQMVLGLLQKVAMTAAPDLLMQGGMHQFEKYAGAMTPQQKAAVDAWLPRLKAQGQSGGNGSGQRLGRRHADRGRRRGRDANRQSPRVADLVLRSRNRRHVPAVFVRRRRRRRAAGRGRSRDARAAAVDQHRDDRRARSASGFCWR